MNYDFCLCCLKPLSESERKNHFHTRCLKKMFGTTKCPSIELNDEILKSLAKKSSQDGITVAGVQKKLSLHLISEKTKGENSSRLTLIGYPQGFILKPQSSEFSYLPQNEHIIMSMAEASGIMTVPHSLIPSTDGELSYITRRIDRSIFEKDNQNQKIHMIDFCQLSERLTEDKYKGSYEQCAKIIRQYSTQSGLDLSDFFYRLLFCFVTGNSDMHLKNFSLIQNPKSFEWTLSSAYDLLSVKLAMPQDSEETALTLNAKKTRLQKKDFLAFAQTIKLPSLAAEKMISKLLASLPHLLQLASTPILPVEKQEELKGLIEERCERLR